MIAGRSEIGPVDVLRFHGSLVLGLMICISLPWVLCASEWPAFLSLNTQYSVGMFVDVSRLTTVDMRSPCYETSGPAEDCLVFPAPFAEDTAAAFALTRADSQGHPNQRDREKQTKQQAIFFCAWMYVPPPCSVVQQSHNLQHDPSAPPSERRAHLFAFHPCSCIGTACH